LYCLFVLCFITLLRESIPLVIVCLHLWRGAVFWCRHARCLDLFPSFNPYLSGLVTL